MSWITTIPYEQAAGVLRTIYDRVKAPDGRIDNITLAQSLRPYSILGHMGLYNYILHHADNTIEPWFLEVVGVYTSLLNRCDYCVAHHMAGLASVLADEPRMSKIAEALRTGDLATAFAADELVALRYVRLLTEHPADVVRADIDALLAAGWDEGQVLELNQVTAYFCYANRTALGLGVSTKGEIIGSSPRNRRAGAEAKG